MECTGKTRDASVCSAWHVLLDGTADPLLSFREKTAECEQSVCDSHVVHQLRFDVSVHVEKIFASSLENKVIALLQSFMSSLESFTWYVKCAKIFLMISVTLKCSVSLRLKFCHG